ncbi:MAG: hypothetical protein JW850_19585 [Thermoflexales bacterium]|nr:hypothetical protein [Thermoflexales bacterium]
MQERIIDLLEQTGPRTGAEIHKALGGERFALWKTCMLSPRLAIRRVGRRYVRLDRRVDGYARLSPSILREFLTYTVVGLADDPAAMDLWQKELEAHIKGVSRKKLELATRIMTDIAAPFTAGGEEENPFCVVVAGDIVYEMAHDVNRPERSTGKMVHGSDLDIVVIVSDEAPGELVNQLDDAIYRKKYQYLKHPAFREEIDYIVKRFSKLCEQAEFDTFQRMVACKILDEAVLLYGSGKLFADGKALLRERGIIDRLRAMEQSAICMREQRERQMLATDEQGLRREDMFLFYPDEESEEFE